MLFREDKVARADAEAIRKGVGFYRWTHDLVEITGKDALEVLQKIYISDISKVAVGRSKYTASLDENGEIIDDVIVMHMADGLYWVSDLYGPRLLPWIEQHKGEADIHAKIITYDWDMYAVQGPDSLKAMNAMLNEPVDELKLTSTSGRAFDSEGRDVLLFENEWSIRLAMENNEGLELAETAVRSAYA